MPVCLYLRGVPGTGKATVGRVLERDLGWPALWVHLFDPVYQMIGSHRVPDLTDELMGMVATHLFNKGKDFLVIRPSRSIKALGPIAALAWAHEYKFVPVRLTAGYDTLAQRVTRRWHESPCRITTREGLDEYLAARPEEVFDGEHVIQTDDREPEEVARLIKELL